ncbi:hypothetical protein [Paraburkholderia sp. J41]|uniref:hypothetical protein n=1 Tax=Paraburkholderia sp. J41 TaxID=2805433 RepID=UPI002AC34737|nr:hypothetical protein [Paraburkholderia sp. J41]
MQRTLGRGEPEIPVDGSGFHANFPANFPAYAALRTLRMQRENRGEHGDCKSAWAGRRGVRAFLAMVPAGPWPFQTRLSSLADITPRPILKGT